jgi:transketolase
MAMALRGSGNSKSRVFVLLSDGDLNEGSTWEAIMFAGQHKLRNLTAIVDWNRLQALGDSSGIMNLGRLAEKWRVFGWTAIETSGHNHDLLDRTLHFESPDNPTCVIAHTTKGKGVSFMEGDVVWHYRSPSNEELEKALEELR